MSYFPYKKTVLKTSLPINEVLSNLKMNMEPKKRFRNSIFGPENKLDYEGELYTDGFSMNRTSDSNKSSAIYINGKFKREQDGTAITLKIIMDFRGFLFLIISFAIFVAIETLLIKQQIINEKFEAASIVVPLFYMIFYGLILGIFNYKSSRAETFLASILKLKSK